MDTRTALRSLVAVDPSLTAAQLAKQLNVSRQRIYQLLDDERLIPGDPNQKRQAAERIRREHLDEISPFRRPSRPRREQLTTKESVALRKKSLAV